MEPWLSSVQTWRMCEEMVSLSHTLVTAWKNGTPWVFDPTSMRREIQCEPGEVNILHYRYDRGIILSREAKHAIISSEFGLPAVRREGFPGRSTQMEIRRRRNHADEMRYRSSQPRPRLSRYTCYLYTWPQCHRLRAPSVPGRCLGHFRGCSPASLFRD